MAWIILKQGLLVVPSILTADIDLTALTQMATCVLLHYI